MSLFDQGNTASTINDIRRISAYAGRVAHWKYSEDKSGDQHSGRLADLQPNTNAAGQLGIRMLVHPQTNMGTADYPIFRNDPKGKLKDLPFGPFKRVTTVKLSRKIPGELEDMLVQLDRVHSAYHLYGEGTITLRILILKES